MRTITRTKAGAIGMVLAALFTGACSPAPEVREDTKPNLTFAPSSTTTLPVAGPAPSFAASATRTSVEGCRIFPPDHFLNAQNIDRLPVHPRSADWTASLAKGGARLGVPSSDIWQGARSGMPFNVVDSRTTPMSNVMLNPNYIGLDIQHTGGYPIPAQPRIEGYPSAQWDKHLLMIDVADCSAYELIGYEPATFRLFGFHSALSGVRYDLNSSERPVLTTNSAGTPMIGQYAMADEVISGNLAHVLGFCTNEISPRHEWPARASDGKSAAADAPPMGTWLRLKGDVDVRRFTGQARTIAEALRNHGMVLTDTCDGDFGLFGESSDQWIAAEMNQLRTLSPLQFEAVDTSPMRRSTTSFAVR
jgi:hypothetical protein